jgi:ubiquinone/menaquinone biosynthesis C-methylase UbiE
MKDITQATYDQIAPTFAEVNAKISENMLLAAQNFLEYIPEKGLCLDLGCGTGRDSAWFEQHRLKMISADFSLGMLVQARQIASWPLVQMDMRQLGFADHVFAGIWCNAALLHILKTEAPLVLKEMNRVLCKDGILDLSIQKGMGEQFETNPYVSEQGQRFFARYDLPEITQLLETSGFTILETAEITFNKRTWLRFIAQCMS